MERERLKREFYLLFKKHNIQIPYTQITVNQEDDKNRQKATPEEVATALKEQKKLRGTNEKSEPKKKNKKRAVINRVKESLNKTKKDLDDE